MDKRSFTTGGRLNQLASFLRGKLVMLSCIAISLAGLRQPDNGGSVEGKVLDENGKGVEFAPVMLYKDGKIRKLARVDVNGNYKIQIAQPITFDSLVVDFTSSGYSRFVIPDPIRVFNKHVILKDIVLSAAGKEVVIIYKPEIDPAYMEQGQEIEGRTLQKTAVEYVNQPPQTTAGVTPAANGKPVRGSGANKNQYIVDGIRVTGTPSLISAEPPATINPHDQMTAEEYKRMYENNYKKVKDDPLSTFSIDVDAAAYSNTRRFLTDNHQLPPADAVRIEEFVNYFDYEYKQPMNDEPFAVNTEVATCPWNSKHKLVHIGLQGRIVDLSKLPPANLVFLIDVSGSMQGENRLGLVKKSLKMLTGNLRPADKVSIVVYAGAAGVVLAPTQVNEKDKILQVLDRLGAGGSTAGGEGILKAYALAKENFVKDGNNRVILATDGDFNVGVSSEGELSRLVEEKRKDGIFLTVLGYGMGNYKDSRLEMLADKGNGNYAYIDNLTEANKVLVEEMGGTLYTIAKDVKIQVEFNPALVKSYRLIGYENRVMGNEEFNDDKKDAGELGSGHTVTALYEIVPTKAAKRENESLKYQTQSLTPAATSKQELMTIKLRYKEPNGDTSKLIEVALPNADIDYKKASDNFRFSAAVAEWCMLLKDSEHKGESNFDHVKKLAQESMGNDKGGYRAEFIRLVEISRTLKEGAKAATDR